MLARLHFQPFARCCPIEPIAAGLPRRFNASRCSRQTLSEDTGCTYLRPRLSAAHSRMQAAPASGEMIKANGTGGNADELAAALGNGASSISSDDVNGGSVTADVLITTTSVGMHLAVGKTLLAASAVGNFSVAFDHECTSLDTQLLKNTAEQQRPSRRQNIPRSSRRQLRRVRAVQTAERPATEAPSKSSEGSAERRMLHGGHGISVVSPPITDMQLPMLCDSPTDAFDLAVAGAGPAGLVVAARVSAAGYKVCIIDPDPLAAWPNNYGVWVDEFQAMGLEDYLEVVWPRANVYLGSEPEDEKFLTRPYGRVDRPKLKRMLLQRCIDSGVLFLEDRVASAAHSDGRSTVSTAGGTSVSAVAVLDATGHALKLVEFEQKFDPGYQGAYGIMCDVESHPFDLDTMLFMDWRDDHTKGDERMRTSNQELPTFLYAMPFSPTTLFLEETSLVAKPAVPFPELKARLERRMAHLGLKVTKVHEEERCLIPMGGVLPRLPQRVLGIGGTAGMVHPSTGYMVARMLGSAPTIADAIIEQLAAPSDRACDGPGQRPDYIRTEQDAEALSRAVWRTVWPRERLQQRAFFNFGQEMLLTLDLQETRDFFRSFFSLRYKEWTGFLSARLSFTELIFFGLSLFLNASNRARVNLVKMGAPGLVGMLIELVKIR